MLRWAFEAAGKDVRLDGGPATVQQYLRAGLVDELDLAAVPVLVGSGERLLDNLGEGVRGYQGVRATGSLSWSAPPPSRMPAWSVADWSP